MPRIPMPARKTNVPDIGTQIMPESNPMGEAIRARERLASTIDNLLSDVIPDIILSAERMKTRDEITKGQVEYNDRIEKSMLDIYKKPDIAKWTEYGQQEHDRIVQDLVGRDISPRAKKELALYAQDTWTRKGTNLALHSKRVIAENERAQLPRTMMSFVRQRDKESFENILDNMASDDPANLLPEEKENWLEAFDKAMVEDSVRVLNEAGDFEKARQVAKDTVDSELRDNLNSMIDGAEATLKRKNAVDLIAVKEQTYSTMLADFWDGNLTNPQIVTDALRAGYIRSEDAKSLRTAMMSKEGPTYSNLEAVGQVEEALLRLREQDGDREEVLQVIAANADRLSPTDGKAFIKEAFSDQDTVNSKWDREAWNYIESQILNVSSMTGMLYGSGEQRALAAQAHIKYTEAKKQAAAEGKPVQGEELLVLAHKIMIPFRQQVKPLLTTMPDKGKLPEELKTTPMTKTRRRLPFSNRLEEFERRSVGMGLDVPKTEPKTVEEFEYIYKRIPTLSGRREYYLKWARKVYK